jgi:tetratricopeptide (TPR) repeat protein
MRINETEGCPDENTLTAFLGGAPEGPELKALERHIAACAACGRLMAELAVSAGSTPSRGAPRGAPQGADADMASLERIPGDRFELGREIARGGMGRIVEAWDRRHRRFVAVKLLIKTTSAAARARFVREARVTARLQHPSIVPLYEAGRLSDDEPFLAMKLVAGEPLDKVVRARARLEDRLLLLPNVVAMTEALAYAHEQGVVHRDLKPSNVLLGAFGETVVIDWGLAKLLGEAEDRTEGTADARAEEPWLSAAGAALGTPAYMPPEQARGDAIDARADVYALGALLYHVLAGAAPYAGEGAKVTLERVLAGPPPPLSTHAPNVPADLATLVDKAMARDPADRYADARAMAEDLRRFASGQLVSAHDYSLGALLRRWVARHRGVVTTAAVLLAALATSSALSIRRVVRERDRADALAVLADEERGVAVTQRDAAEKLVGFVLGRLRERLDALGKLDLLAGLGAEVDGYYRTLGPNNDSLDAAPLERRGTALHALADVEMRKRNYDSAIALERSAIGAFEVAHRKDARDPEPAALLVVARAATAGMLARAGQSDEALIEATRSVDTAVEVSQGEGSSHLSIAAAVAESRLAFLRATHADLDGAGAAAARAREWIARAGPATELDVFWQEVLGTAYRDLGGASTRAQDWPLTAETCRAAIELRRAELRAEPDHAEYMTALAYMQRGLAFAEEKLGHPDAALDSYHESIALHARLLEREPADTTVRYDQGVALSLACDLERAWHGANAAERDCMDARAALARVVAAQPGDVKAEDAMGRALRVQARWYLAAGRREEALHAFQDAVEFATHAAARDPSSFVLESAVTESLDGKARVELALGRLDAAQADASDALAREEKQLTLHPTVTFFEGDIGMRKLMAGDVARARGDAPAARRDYDEAIAHLQRAAAADPKDIEVAIAIAKLDVRLAGLTTAPAERRALLEKAQALVAPLDAAGQISPEGRADVGVESQHARP